MASETWEMEVMKRTRAGKGLMPASVQASACSMYVVSYRLRNMRGSEHTKNTPTMPMNSSASRSCNNRETF